MNRLAKVSIAVACALGATAVAAQTVQRGGQAVTPVQVVGPAQTRAPVQVAQTVFPFGGQASGAAPASTATAGAATAGTVAIIAFGVVAVVGAVNGAGSSVEH